MGSVSLSYPPPQRDVAIDVAQLRRDLENSADAARNAATAAGAVDSATGRCVAAAVPSTRISDADDASAAAAADASQLLPAPTSSPSLPSPSPASSSSSAVTAPAAPRLIDLALLGIKSNFLPGLALQSFALLLTILYYTSPAVNAAFDVVARWKDEGGYVFSGLVTSVAAGILPFMLILSRRMWKAKQKRLRDSNAAAAAVAPVEGVEMSVAVDAATSATAGAAAAPSAADAVWHDGASLYVGRSVSSPSTSGPAVWKETLFLIIFWLYKGVEIDAFYRLQTVMWGADNSAGTIIAKVLTDQLGFSVVWNEYSIVSAYLWKDGDFSFAAWMIHMRSRHFWTRTLPTTWCTTWLVWIPILFVMYALPDPLQIPLFAIVSCFYSILIDFITQNNK